MIEINIHSCIQIAEYFKEDSVKKKIMDSRRTYMDIHVDVKDITQDDVKKNLPAFMRKDFLSKLVYDLEQGWGDWRKVKKIPVPSDQVALDIYDDICENSQGLKN
jgi:hypothetical protein